MQSLSKSNEHTARQQLKCLKVGQMLLDVHDARHEQRYAGTGPGCVPGSPQDLAGHPIPVFNVLKMAARSPTYCLATPFCPRSLLLRDLSEYYGSEAKVEALASAQRRIVACLLCRERPLYNIPVTEYMQSSIDACVRPLCASPPSRYNQDECSFSTDGVEKRDPACEAIKYIR